VKKKEEFEVRRGDYRLRQDYVSNNGVDKLKKKQSEKISLSHKENMEIIKIIGSQLFGQYKLQDLAKNKPKEEPNEILYRSIDEIIENTEPRDYTKNN